jgi:hypothetical protein
MPLGRISVTASNQPLDHLDHLRNIRRRARHVIRLKRPHSRHIVQKPLGRLCGDLSDRPTALRRTCVDLVIHVGKISHIGHMIRPVDMAQQPVQHVEHDHWPRVAQMGAVIHRGPADIHPHVFRVDGNEILAFAGFRVVQLDRRHMARPYASMARAWHICFEKKTL